MSEVGYERRLGGAIYIYIVDDPGFTQYISVSDPQLQQQHKADLNRLIYGEFEQQKIIFGDEENMKNQSLINWHPKLVCEILQLRKA